MEDNKAFWEATMGAAYNTFNLYMTFMTYAGIGFQAAFLPPPDNTKRNRLLADLQHGLRDENPDRCDKAMSSLAAEFSDQDLVYSCLLMSAIESFELFGPELAYRMIDNMGMAEPKSRIRDITANMLVSLTDYCDYDQKVRSTTFHSLSRIMSKAGISGAILNRGRDYRDFKTTHRDVRHWITPVEFLGRFQDYQDVPRPIALG